MKEYYISAEGRQFGPVSVSDLHKMLESGQISGSALCWRMGMSQWQPASTLFSTPTADSAGGMAVPTGKPDNNMIMAILATLCCCPPFGIAAIVKSASVDSCWHTGRYEEAAKCAEASKKYCRYSLYIAGAFWGLFVLTTVMGLNTQ